MSTIQNMIRKSYGLAPAPLTKPLSVRAVVERSLGFSNYLPPTGKALTVTAIVRRSVGIIEPVNAIFDVRCANCGKSSIMLTRKGKCPICHFNPR